MSDQCGVAYVTLGYTVLWCSLPKGHDGPHRDDQGNSWEQGDNGVVNQ